jgi:hypothetical protein
VSILERVVPLITEAVVEATLASCCELEPISFFAQSNFS